MNGEGRREREDLFRQAGTKKKRSSCRARSHLGSAVLVLMTAGVLSRATMPLIMLALPNARHTGLSHSVGDVSGSATALGIAIAVVFAFLLIGGAAFWAIVSAMTTTLILGAIANQKIKGQTGDVLGACQQISEITVLLCLTATVT